MTAQLAPYPSWMAADVCTHGLWTRRRDDIMGRRPRTASTEWSGESLARYCVRTRACTRVSSRPGCLAVAWARHARSRRREELQQSGMCMFWDRPAFCSVTLSTLCMRVHSLWRHIWTWGSVAGCGLRLAVLLRGENHHSAASDAGPPGIQPARRSHLILHPSWVFVFERHMYMDALALPA